MAPDWTLGPFHRIDAANPILEPRADTVFRCPLAGPVKWEEKDVFNPAAVIHEGRVALLYRAEDSIGRFAGTSRIGLAFSDDGLAFEREPVPVFYPGEDALNPLEWEGGCEDPRVVATEDGYLMTYTAYDGHTARLCVATSPDLRQWTKHGLAFRDQPDLWSKSGSIVCQVEDERLVASRIQGRYWMYWGESDVFAASSSDLLSWTTVGTAFGPRKGMHDSNLVEPGPPAVLTERGIVLIYNSKNADDPSLPPGTYSAGQALFDPEDPTWLLDRTERPFFLPERDYEKTGQIGNVTFLEGLVRHRGRWFLYYGTADSKIAVAASAS